MQKYFLNYPSFISNIFDGQKCRCLTCYPSDDGAQVPVLVTQQSATDLIIRNGIFKNFEDAKGVCNLLAKLEKRQHFTNGNKEKNKIDKDQPPKWQRVKCSGCKDIFMSFWFEYDDKSRLVRVRLYDHEFLVKWLEHSCRPGKKNAEV